jgi:uncharacterized Zn-binding protein involved in type VI secretion
MAKTAILGTRSTGRCVHSLKLLVNGGEVITASDDTFAGPAKKGVARIDDLVKCDICGRTGTIDIASTTVFVNGKGRARIGDHFSGAYEGTLVSNPVDTIDVGG